MKLPLRNIFIAPKYDELVKTNLCGDLCHACAVVTAQFWIFETDTVN